MAYTLSKSVDDSSGINSQDFSNVVQYGLDWYDPEFDRGLSAFDARHNLTFNGTWNEYFRPLIFLSTNENFTLPLGVVTLFGYLGTGSVSVVLAGVVLSLLPVLVVYTVGQRYLIEGIAMGGLKG